MHIKKFSNGGKNSGEKNDSWFKKSGTRFNKLRLKRAEKKLEKTYEKHGDSVEAAEKSARAVKKVFKAEDRVAKIKALEGTDDRRRDEKKKKKKYKTPKPPRNRRRRGNRTGGGIKLPTVRFAGQNSPKQNAIDFGEQMQKGKKRASKKAGCFGKNHAHCK